MSNFKHNKNFGQHFLHDPHVLGRIVDAIAPKPDDNLLEIGPGLGALTAVLLPALSHLSVVEIDARCVAALAQQHDPSRLTIYAQDILTFDFSVCPKPLRLVGNLPYNISTPLIFHCLAAASDVQDMHFMVQKEVADRMASLPNQKSYGRLSVMVQHACTVTTLFHVPPGAFHPPPKVMSSVCRLVPKPHVLTGREGRLFAEIVKVAFMQRRKQLCHPLKRWWSKEALYHLDIDPTCRAENVSPEDFARLAKDLARR